MPCIPRKKLRSVKIIALDACGRIPLTGDIVLDNLDFESIVYRDDLEQGERELIINVAGEPCVDDEACPIDRGVQLTFNECRENDSLAQLAGFGQITQTLAVVDGFDRTDYACGSNTAVELIFEIPTICDANGDPQCIGQIFPLVTAWNSTAADKTINGRTTVRGGYTARAKKNARLFEFFDGTPPLPAELAHWQPWVTSGAFAAGTQYYLRRVFDCPPLTTPSCDLRPLA